MKTSKEHFYKSIFSTTIIFLLAAGIVLFINAANYIRLWEISSEGLSTLSFIMTHIIYTTFGFGVAGIIFGFMIYNAYGKRKVAAVKKIKVYDSEKDQLEKYPKEKREEVNVYKVIEKKKKVVRAKRIPELLYKLYNNQIKYYPQWIKNDEARQLVCSLVTDAARLPDGRIKINLKGKEYAFLFKKNVFPDHKGNSCVQATMELFKNDKKVLGLNTSPTNQMTLSSWISSEVQAFIEGDWIDDFKQLQRQIEYETEAREASSRHQSIEKIKRDFGID